MSKEPNWPDPVAHLIERHAFRCSPHGQDAEVNDWLEVDEEVSPKAFPVYTAAQVTEMLASLRSELEAARGKVKALGGALENVLAVVQKYLPPGGISSNQAIAEIIPLVDPWPTPNPQSPTTQPSE